MKKIISIIFSLLTLFSCNKISVEDIPSSAQNILENSTYDEYALEFAKAINVAINNHDDFRSLIKDEVMKQFDGDYDLLVKTAFDKTVAASHDMITKNNHNDIISVKEMLAHYCSVADMQTKSSVAFLDELVDKYPELQISVPVHAEEWDPETYVPSIAIVPYDFCEFETKTVPGINADGEFIEIDAINPPEEPVIVVSLNERVTPLVVNPGFSGPKATIAGQYLGTRIQLSVTTANFPSTASITSINICRAVNSNDFSVIGNTSLLNNNYSDWNVFPNNEYVYYAIVNYTNGGVTSSVQSNIIIISTNNSSLPNSISNLKVTNEFARKNHLEWNNPVVNNFETLIYRTTASTTQQLIATLPSSETEYYDEPVTPGEKWIYSVKKHNPNTDAVSAHLQKYIYNPYRNPSAISKVMMKEVHIGESAESWLDGRPEIIVTVYGATKDMLANEIETVLLGTPIDYQIQNTITNTDTGLNKLMADWSFFDDSYFYPVLNINMREYDRASATMNVTLEAQCGYKLADAITLEACGSIELSLNKKNKDCGTIYLRYYENPEQVLTFTNHDAYIRISEVDDNNI